MIYNKKDEQIDFKAKVFIVSLSNGFSDVITNKSDLDFFNKKQEFKKNLF